MATTQPLVSGFTFIKNGLTLGYPIKESIESIEPLCDEIVINVGYDDPNLEKDDGTYEYLQDTFNHSKFIFLKSHWNPELTKSGLVLSEQTNIALHATRGKYCQYIQGDEALHEVDLKNIHDGVIDLERPENRSYDGLVFNYKHFYGNVDVIKETRNIYRREVRLIRGQKGIKSWLDAQGFRHQNDSKLKCKRIDATVYHYGWARKEQVMGAKVKAMDKLYHGNDFDAGKFEYEKIWGLKKFKGTHPAVMKDWIQTHKNELDILSLPMRHEWKNVGLAFSDVIENISGYRLGEYKNYKL